MGEMCSRFSHADHWSFSPQVTEVFLEPREGRVSLERRVQSASLGLAFQDLPAPKVNPQDKAALGGPLLWPLPAWAPVVAPVPGWLAARAVVSPLILREF